MLGSHANRAAAATTALLVLALSGPAELPAQTEAETLSASFRKAARRVLPAVVTVRPAGERGPAPFRRFPVPEGLMAPRPPSGGSGVVIDAEKGYVVTNDHVVDGLSRVAVVLHDGRERVASQVRRDPKSDLALLIVDGKGLSQATWGDSEALDTGDWVLAIGQPYGLSDTVTAGIVSGKGRGVGMAMYEDLIQTDAAINPGNSGGPLVNMKGEVVGINTAIATRHGGFDGVGFAIPAARARRVARDLAELGRVRRAYLGVQIGPVDPSVAEKLDQPGAVRINGLTPDSPAAKAGLRLGDVILKLGDQPVRGVEALQAAVEVAKVGEPLTLSIDRDGDRREIKVSPEEQPETFGLPEGPPRRPFRGLPGPPRGSEPPLETPAGPKDDEGR